MWMHILGLIWSIFRGIVYARHENTTVPRLMQVFSSFLQLLVALSLKSSRPADLNGQLEHLLPNMTGERNNSEFKPDSSKKVCYLWCSISNAFFTSLHCLPWNCWVPPATCNLSFPQFVFVFKAFPHPGFSRPDRRITNPIKDLVDIWILCERTWVCVLVWRFFTYFYSFYYAHWYNCNDDDDAND